MLQFKMVWPQLNLSVRCQSCGKNENALKALIENMPIKTIQGHEMVGGWMLRNRSVYMGKRFFDIPPQEMESECMKDAPVGRISLLFPQGNSTEMLVKYDECEDSRSYTPVADVVEEDLETLKQVGKLQWKSATRTKEVLVVEFVAED
ncbi:hypothetical protein DWX58_11870 [Pseudoflavonifractor sp. AF19-9AC]|nr:hypothetical protein DWX58_11870 [Pseudoflavonifractor sp. AF19-9AC]